MKTFAKILGVIVGIIIILVIALKLYFTDQRLKAMILPRMDEALGRQVQVDHFSLTFLQTFPNVGLTMSGLVIPGEGKDSLVTLRELVVGVKVLPLIAKKVDISKIELVQPHFVYTVEKNGRSNLERLVNKFSSGGKSTQSTPNGIPVINISKFTIEDAYFGYVNRKDNSSILLKNLNADISLSYAAQIKSNVNIGIGGLSVMMNGSDYISNLPLSIKQESVIDMNRHIMDLTGGSMAIRGLTLNVNGSISDWDKAQPVVNLKFQSGSNDFGELLKLVPAKYKKQVQGLETRGKLTLSGTVNGPVGGKTPPKFDVILAVNNGYVKNPNLPEPIKNIEIQLNANDNEVKLTRFQADAGSNQVSATGNMTKPLEKNAHFTVNMNGNVDLATVDQFYSLKNLGVSSIKGTMHVKATADGNRDNPQNAKFNADVQLKNGYLMYAHASKPFEDINLIVSANQNKADIKTFNVKAAGNSLSLSGVITEPMNEKKRGFDIQTKANVNLATIKEFYPIGDTLQLGGLFTTNASLKGRSEDLAHVRATGEMNLKNVNISGKSLPKPVKNLNAALKFNQSLVDLNNLSMSLGASDITIDGKLAQYMILMESAKKATKPAELSGSYHSRFLDVDQLINWNAPSANDTAAVPIHLPNVNSTLTAKIDSMVVLGVPMTKLAATVKTTPKMVEMPKGGLHLFGGNVSGAFTWNVIQPTSTHLKSTGKLENLQAEKFFKEYHVLGKKSQFFKYISGKFSADAVYQTDLDKTLSPVIKSSYSKGTFGMENVRLKGNPVQNELADLLKDQSLKDIVLDNWKANYVIQNGILTMHNVRITHKDIGMELDGTQNLIDDRLNYTVKIYLPKRFGPKLASILSKQAVEALTQKNGTIAIPMKIVGTSEKPKVGVDREVVKKIVEDYAKNLLKRKLKGIFNSIRH